ncbi:hypothetical protein BDN71DRAFT_1440357 [Pleurotus eryngii]|uniref:Uncharacterized protein n=1 Tax=Pleurotus eryngii TaxID=5323 RepID=A0A9P6DBD6_PLEER|nr:hypothetical protein BDN71DRAFT_1440357 [Pleurotus eryngii]
MHRRRGVSKPLVTMLQLRTGPPSPPNPTQRNNRGLMATDGATENNTTQYVENTIPFDLGACTLLT